MDNRKVGELIHRLRKEQNMTQKQLAEWDLQVRILKRNTANYSGTTRNPVCNISFYNTEKT